MKYVYLLESINFPEEIYIGLTDDLRARFAAHNPGHSLHTAKCKPWRLVTYLAFSDESKAIAFERYSRPRLDGHSPESASDDGTATAGKPQRKARRLPVVGQRAKTGLQLR
ncbi:MAG: GIY-YIG nuclease family protein [Xanthobacteraceae bacterium]